MATSTVYPRDCDPTNCCCSAPNGFGPDGNRVCLTFGPARQPDDDSETPIAPCYEVCDYCDDMVIETEMGNHKCPEALAVLREVAREFLEHEAGEHESDNEEEDEDAENEPLPAGTS